jgi:hypothetical protein
MPEEENEPRRFPYHETIGCLNYISVMTRPDISFAVNKAAKYCENPLPAHRNAVKRIMRYLKMTLNYGQCYGHQKENALITVADSDFAGDVDTARSTSGTVNLLNGRPVMWSSSTQSVTALASTEAEYMAMSVAAKDIIWLRGLLMFILCTKHLEPCPVYVYNQGAIALRIQASALFYLTVLYFFYCIRYFSSF